MYVILFYFTILIISATVKITYSILIQFNFNIIMIETYILLMMTFIMKVATIGHLECI